MAELRRCTRCLLPETHETIVFDREGVCNNCRGQEIKQAQLDWQSKKKELIFKAFLDARGSYVETAKILDIHPNYLHRLIRNLNIKEELENSLR